MLTPQMIDAMNKATGNNVPLDGQPKPPSRADQIRQIGTQAQATPPAPATPPQSGFSIPNPNDNPIAKGVYDVAGGIDKSIGSTVIGAANIGKKIGNLASNIPGLGYLKTPENSPAEASVQKAQDAMQPSNTGEAIGKVAGDVGQFFIPGGAEATAGKSLDKIIDTAKFAEKFGPAAGDALANILKIAGKGGITAASMAGVTAAQTGGNVDATVNAGKIGFLAGGIGKALEVFAPPLVKALQKADFKLSPMQEARATQKAEGAAQFMTDNKIVGSSGDKYKKLSAINDKFETALQSSLPDNGGVPVKDVIDSLNGRVESLKTSDPAIYQAARNEADQAIALLQKQGGDTGAINMKDALAGKRSYGSQAFKTSKYATKDPRVTAEGAYAVEQAYQGALEKNLERVDGSIDVPKELRSYFGGKSKVTLPEFNKEYSKAITAKNLTFTSQFKNDSGLVGRLFGLWAGESLGQTIAPGLPGKIIGGAAGEIASTRLPGLARNLSERALSTSESTLPNVAKVGLGINNNLNQ